MKVPLSWLKQFVRMTGSPTALAEKLTMAGIEVEAIIDRAKDFEKVVVGEIVHVRPHPNADKLRLAFVVVENGGSPQEIVCGAPNIAVGQKVAVALLGARLPNGMTIEARNIRGVASHGMICAEDELGLGTRHDGTMELDPALKIGTPFAKAFGLDDIVFDVSVPTNRADLLSVRGIAREVAALLGVPMRAPALKLKESSVPAARSVSIGVTDKHLCPWYTARVIRGVSVRPSPELIQRRLRLCGIRPINAVVDATNYVMLEYGQPLHAFDASTLQGSRLTVRRADAEDELTTLDSVQRALDPSMLVIADSRGPIALAGVMGGAATEISDRTTDIILESAIFDAASIRRTSMILGLRSEASHRFERGLPMMLPEEASAAAAALIAEWCGGTVERGVVTTGTRVSHARTVHITVSYISELLGMAVAPAEAKRLLTRLGFTVRGTATIWKVTVPPWRLDVAIAEDIVDEISRLIGYRRLPEVLPLMEYVPKPLPQLIQLKDDIRDLLVGFGFIETITHAYYGALGEQSVGGTHYEVANPLDKSQQYLRKSLLPHLREIIHSAVDAGRDANIFQIGRVFVPAAGTPVSSQQPWKLAIAMAFKAPSGYCAGRKITGILDELFAALGVLGVSVKPQLGTATVKGRTIEWCEVDIATVRNNFAPFTFTPLPKFPAVHRDVSFWVPGSLQFREIESAVTEAGAPLLEAVELFDVFERSGKRSYALHLTFRSPERTLTDDEILAKMKVITERLQARGAELR